MTTNNSNNPNDDSDDLEKIDADITNHRLRAFLFIVLVLVLYFYLGDKKLPESAQSWGTFGDFIGGILNPIFALFAFYWLTYSVRLQIKELKDTRIELQKAADAQVETAQHQENIANLEKKNVKTQEKILELQTTSLQTQIESTRLQQRQIELQNFESLFFELLKTKSGSLENILYEEIIFNENFSVNLNPDINNKILSGPTYYRSIDAVKKHTNDFKLNHKEEWKEYYKKYLLGYMGSYFRICYQIVNLIDQNPTLRKSSPVIEKKYSIDQKKYFDIFRSTISQYELEAFFFNCLSPYGNKKFKILIEKYGLLEPLLIDTSSSNTATHPLTKYAYQYDRIIFEENPDWNEYFYDLNKIDLSIDANETIKNLKYIEQTKIHLGFDNNRKYCLLSFEEISKRITEKVTLLSEKLKNTTNATTLSFELLQQKNELNNFEKVTFTYEMYMILKYGIDLEDYIKTKKEC